MDLVATSAEPLVVKVLRADKAEILFVQQGPVEVLLLGKLRRIVVQIQRAMVAEEVAGL